MELTDRSTGSFGKADHGLRRAICHESSLVSGYGIVHPKLKVTDPAKFKAEGEVEFMACNDETCLPPDQIPFSFDKKSIHVDPALAANSSTTEVDKEDATAIQPDTQVVAEEASELNTPDPAAKETPATTSPKASDSLTDSPNLWSPVIDQLKSFGDSTVSAADTSWLFIFFAGFLGGLIAFIDSCVWPMIPMTVSFFLKRYERIVRKQIRDDYSPMGYLLS